MSEDKAKIAKMLGALLKKTREYEDLESMQYETDGKEEWVIATFKDGYRRRVCVTANSGIAIIRQVAREL